MITSQLLDDSLRTAGVIVAPGQTPSNSRREEALGVLNAILDAGKAERRFVYSTPRMGFPLTPGVQSYSIGPGGNINIPRPPKIEMASIIVSNQVELPLAILTEAQDWQNIQLKALGATYPAALYYDRAFPVGNIFLWPIPGGGVSLMLYPWQQIDEVGSLSTDLQLPPAYRSFLLYQIAFELAPKYSKAPRPDIAVLAQRYKAVLETRNAPNPALRSDSGLLRQDMGRGGGSLPVILGSGPAGGGGGGAVQWVPSIESPDGARTVFSFISAPVYTSLNGLNSFEGQLPGFVRPGTNQITFKDVAGNAIAPDAPSSVMGELL